jgi:hypothetical protein
MKQIKFRQRYMEFGCCKPITTGIGSVGASDTEVYHQKSICVMLAPRPFFLSYLHNAPSTKRKWQSVTFWEVRETSTWKGVTSGPMIIQTFFIVWMHRIKPYICDRPFSCTHRIVYILCETLYILDQFSFIWQYNQISNTENY